MAGGRNKPRASPTRNQRWPQHSAKGHALKVRLATFALSGPRGPENAPRFWRSVISRGGMTSVGLTISTILSYREDAKLHVGHDSTCGRLHDGHLPGLGALAESLLGLCSVVRVTSQLEDLDSISHLLPPDTRDAVGQQEALAVK